MNSRGHNIPRVLLSLLASLVAGAICARIIAALATALVGVTGPRDSVVIVGILGNLSLVPLAVGCTIGLTAPRWPLPMAIGSVLLSLIGTYFALGVAGIPTGWKIVQYVLQLFLVYMAAKWTARSRLLTSGITARIA